MSEFEEAGNLLEANRDATTISIEDEEMKPHKQRNAAGFAADEDGDTLGHDDQEEVRTRLVLTWNFYSFHGLFTVTCI